MLKKTLAELGSHSFIYLIGSVLSVLSGIVLLPVYTRFLVPSDYGILEIVDGLRGFLVVCLLLGLLPAMTKFYKSEDDPQAQHRVMGTVFWLVLGSSVAGAAIFAAMAPWIADVALGNRGYADIARLTALLLLLESLLTYCTSYLNTLKASRLFVLVSLVRLLIGIAANLWFIVVWQLGPRGMLYGELVSLAVVLLYLMIKVTRETGLRVDFSLVPRMVAFGLPFVPAVTLGALLHRADRYLIQHYQSLAQVGLYGLGYKFPFLLNSLLLGSFDRAWSSSIMYDVDRMADSQRIYAKITTYFFALFLVCLTALACMAQTVVRVLANNPEYFSAWVVVQIVSLGVTVYAVHNFFIMGAFLRNKTSYLPVAYFVGAAVNIGLNVLLIPRFGYLAAAWVTVISYAAFSLSCYLLFRKIYPAPYEFGRMAILLVFAALTVLLDNAVVLSNPWVEGVKEAAFALAVPLFLLLGPFFSSEEKTHISQLLHRIHPRLGTSYGDLALRERATGAK